MSNLLMSKDNPNGHKLEELLETIQEELNAKSELLTNDDCPVSQAIKRNNGYINSLLSVAESMQRDSMDLLDTLGIDPGPHSQSRV